MGLMKINQILKKYKQLYKKHQDSWEDAQKRIRISSQKIQDEMKDPDRVFTCEKTYRKESYDYQLRGNKLLEAMMKELSGHEIFPKRIKQPVSKN